MGLPCSGVLAVLCSARLDHRQFEPKDVHSRFLKFVMSGKVAVATDVSPQTLRPREGFTEPYLDHEQWNSLLSTLPHGTESNGDSVGPILDDDSAQAVNDRLTQQPTGSRSTGSNKRNDQAPGAIARRQAKADISNPVSGRRIDAEFGSLRHELLKRNPTQRLEFMNQLSDLWDRFSSENPIDTSKTEGARRRQPYETYSSHS
jgi:hypothetical protein